jgi:iron(III) transport system substrate-binding protein
LALIIGGCVFDDLFDDCRNAEKVAQASDVGGAVSIGKQAIVTDAMEALGEDVDQETADELMGVERHRLPAIGSIISAPSGILKAAPNPNAGRLFHSWLHGIEAQQLLIDFACQHSVHAQAREKPGRRKLADIKLMQEDPAGVEKAAGEIKARYAQIFKV